MTDKFLIQVSKIISVLFKPFYFPVIAFIVLLLFSYMSLLPVSVKLTVLVIVYVFTVVLPLLSIYLYRKINGWTRHQASRRTRRLVPYILSMVCYGCCLYVMMRMRMPHFMSGILVGALAIQLVCAIINRWFKISTHSAAAGRDRRVARVLVHLLVRPHVVAVPYDSDCGGCGLEQDSSAPAHAFAGGSGDACGIFLRFHQHIIRINNSYYEAFSKHYNGQHERSPRNGESRRRA